MTMTQREAHKLRTRLKQAETREEDIRWSIADDERELAACDPHYEGKKMMMLQARLEHSRVALKDAGDEVDRLRAELRAADLPPEPITDPRGGVETLLARDQGPVKWNTGGLYTPSREDLDRQEEARRANREARLQGLTRPE